MNFGTATFQLHDPIRQRVFAARLWGGGDVLRGGCVE